MQNKFSGINLKVSGLFTLALVIVSMAGLASRFAQPIRAKTSVSASVNIVNEMPVGATLSYTYKGKHSDWVNKLLTRVGGWECPATASDKGTPPKVKADECMRDKYVAAAVLYAWAAECYARNEEDSKAEAAAEQMYSNLKSASDLCSNAPSFGGGTCPTETIFKCGEL